MNKETVVAYKKALSKLSFTDLCILRDTKIHQLELTRKRLNQIKGVKEKEVTIL